MDSNNLKVCSIVDHIFNTGKSRFNTKSDLEDFIRLNFGHGREYLISESLINKSDLSLIRSILNNLLLNLDPLYLQLDIISRNSVFNLLKLLRQDFDLYIISGSSKSSINHILGEDKFVFRDILSCRDGQNKSEILIDLNKLQNILWYAGDSYCDYLSTVDVQTKFSFITDHSVCTKKCFQYLLTNSNNISENLIVFLKYLLNKY